MATTQEGRLLSIKTPLEDDHLLLNAFEATEGMSQLFSIDADLVFAEPAEGIAPTIVDPQDLLGGNATIRISPPEEISREFSGIISEFTQQIRDTNFTYYKIRIVPHIWVMTKRKRSQIFQNKSVREILEKMFEKFEVKFEFAREYEPRNYCVQYRESDFAFVSRLMEEEGIYYYFIHENETDKLIVADSTRSHQPCPTKDTIAFHMLVEGEPYEAATIRNFDKGHFLKSGKVTLWDHNFQLPGKTLDREETSQYTYGDNKKMEVYDYPGGYARKYDGISAGGGKQDAEIQKIYPDRDQTTKLWMEGIDSQVEKFSGRGDCCTITSGHKFSLTGHPNEDFNKQYVITTVQHSAEQSPSYLPTEIPISDPYLHIFTCIEVGSGLPCFRPPRETRKPIVYGGQTAYVVGPPGEEIYCDEFGRVKVQFHWDREGEMNDASSCWIRATQSLAGHNWGGMIIPRIGMEVLVHFLEGNPDNPIITGCVYNPKAMPPYKLPDEKTKSTFKTNSTPDKRGFNELRFEDLKDKEQVFIHGERDMDVRIKNDRRDWAGNDQHLWVVRDRFDKVVRDEHHLVERHQYQQIKQERHLKVDGDEKIEITGSRSLKITGSFGEGVTANKSEEIGGTFLLKASTVVIDAPGITLKSGGSFVTVNGSGVHISGPIVNINSGGAALSASTVGIAAPKPPEGFKEADDAKPGTITKLQRESDKSKEEKTGKEDEKKLSWIKIKLVDEAGKPVRGERVKIKTPDGKWRSGSTNQEGVFHAKGFDPGSCEVRFPNLDKDAWE